MAFAVIAAVAPPGQNRYRNEPCGYTFVYPSDWHIRPAAGRCSVEVHSLVKRGVHIESLGVDLNVIVVTSGNGGFDEGAKAAGFYVPDAEDESLTATERKNVGKWLAFSQVVPAEAEAVESAARRGLKAEVAARCWGKGGYKGLCSEFVGFLTDGHRWVAVASWAEAAPLKALFESIRIQRVPPN